MSDKRPSSSPPPYHIAPRCAAPRFPSRSSSRRLHAAWFPRCARLPPRDPLSGDLCDTSRARPERSSTWMLGSSFIDWNGSEVREMTIVSNDDRHVRSCFSHFVWTMSPQIAASKLLVHSRTGWSSESSRISIYHPRRILFIGFTSQLFCLNAYIIW